MAIPNKQKIAGKSVSLAQIRAAAKAKEEEKKKNEEIKRLIAEEAKKKQEEDELRLKQKEENMKKIKEKEEKSLLAKKFSRFFIQNKKEIVSKNNDIVENKEKLEIKQENEFNSPILCILGHVDTGKTKILDKIRETNIQGDEAGGITQQIGATFFPAKILAKKYNIKDHPFPGILIIDTPGHESFTSIRSRGSDLCDVAILVVDIMHGLEPQTRESIGLLKSRKTPFVISLNKVDRIYGWVPGKSYSEQSENTLNEFKKLYLVVQRQMAEVNVNCVLFDLNKDKRRVVSMIPTSAITGDGLEDIFNVIFDISEKYMKTKLRIVKEVSCSVLEVKSLEGFGTVIDCININGTLEEGNEIAMCGYEGEPIITTIKNILVPEPLIELRVKGAYASVKKVVGSAGIKIVASGLEDVVAGSKLYVIDNNNKIEVLEEIRNKMSMVSTGLADEGITLASDTFGSMEALVSFFDSKNIPVARRLYSRITKKGILKVASSKKKIYRIILSFNVKINKETEDFAKVNDVVIFTGEIIYHLFDFYYKYSNKIKLSDKEANRNKAVFPVELNIIKNCVFCQRTPLVIGVEVKRGILKLNTPLCVFQDNKVVKIGHVVSIEENRNVITEAKKGCKVAIKIENDTSVVFGKHFSYDNSIFSIISRGKLDIIKTFFADELTKEDIELLFYLKNKFEII